VQIGYHNYGRTRDLAYEENTRIAEKILGALLRAGVPRESIESQAVHLGRVDTGDKEWTSEQKRERQFEARQSWAVRVSVPEAQKILDWAVTAGANEVQDVDWTVADPKGLEAKASATAVGKAREMAEQMARKLGAKVGELLYADNARPTIHVVTRSGLSMASLQLSIVTAPPKPQLMLFPKKVEREATVNAVFALE